MWKPQRQTIYKHFSPDAWCFYTFILSSFWRYQVSDIYNYKNVNLHWITCKFKCINVCFCLIKAAVLGVTVVQSPKVLAKAKGKTVYLPCKVTSMSSSDYIHWYQIKEGEAPSRLLYISSGGDATRDTNNPQANDFSVDKNKLYDLKLSNTQKSHAAVYFCAYWDSSRHSEKIYSHPVHELNWQCWMQTYTCSVTFCLSS